MTGDIHPALIFFVGALLVALLPARGRSLASLLVPVGGMAALLGYEHGSFHHPQIFDYTLTLMRVDKLSLLFGYLFHIAAFIGVVYALHVKDRVQQVASLAYAGSALVAVFAGDMITLFVAWELLAITSVFLVFARRTERSIAVGMRYLVMNVLSGVILLAGVLVVARETGSIAFDRMELEGVGTWLHPARLRHQVRVPAGPLLDHGDLPRVDPDRHCIPVGVHHQDGGPTPSRAGSPAPTCWSRSAR